jgi:hypothetical protein
VPAISARHWQAPHPVKGADRSDNPVRLEPLRQVWLERLVLLVKRLKFCAVIYLKYVRPLLRIEINATLKFIARVDQNF